MEKLYNCMLHKTSNYQSDTYIMNIIIWNIYKDK